MNQIVAEKPLTGNIPEGWLPPSFMPLEKCKHELAIIKRDLQTGATYPGASKTDLENYKLALEQRITFAEANLLEIAVRGCQTRQVHYRAFRGFDYEYGDCLNAHTVVVFADGKTKRKNLAGWEICNCFDDANAALLELHHMNHHREATPDEYRLLEMDFGVRSKIVAEVNA